MYVQDVQLTAEMLLKTEYFLKAFDKCRFSLQHKLGGLNSGSVNSTGWEDFWRTSLYIYDTYIYICVYIFTYIYMYMYVCIYLSQVK